jgi:hypothetical protein
MACSKQKNSVWFLSFPVMNFILEYTHYRKNQGSILIKIGGKQEGVFRQFDGFGLGEGGGFRSTKLSFNHKN